MKDTTSSACAAAAGDCLPPAAGVWSEAAGGLVQLRDVKVGDRLLALHPATNAPSFVTVLDISTEAAEAASWVCVRVAGAEILLTASHPMKPEGESDVIRAAELCQDKHKLWVARWEVAPVEEVRPVAAAERPCEAVSLDFEGAESAQILVASDVDGRGAAGLHAAVGLGVCSCALQLPAKDGKAPPSPSESPAGAEGACSEGEASPEATNQLKEGQESWAARKAGVGSRRWAELCLPPAPTLARTSSEPVIGDSMSTGSLSARSAQSLPLDVEMGFAWAAEPGWSAECCGPAEAKAARSKKRRARAGASDRSAQALELAESLGAWQQRRPDLGQLLALAETCFGGRGGAADAGMLGDHPQVLARLAEVSQRGFALMHVKSTSSSSRQPFLNTVLDTRQLASLRAILPESFAGAGPLALAQQQLTMLILVVTAQESSNAAALLTAPRARNVLDGLRKALLPVADGCACSANTLRLIMNFLSELRVSLIKVLASGLMRGRGGHSRFHQHAMMAQQACNAFLCGMSVGAGDIERRMAVLHSLAQAHPAVLAKKLEAVLLELTAPLD